MKYLVCVLLAVFALQASAATTRYAVQEERGIFEDMKQAIEKIMKYIIEQFGNQNEEMNEVLATIQQLIETIKNEFESIINEIFEQKENILPEAIQTIKNKIKEEITKIKANTDKFIQTAQKTGKDVTKCVTTFNQEINDLQNKMIEETRACVQDIIKDIFKLVKDIISTVEPIIKKVKELYNKIKACTNPICILKVGKEVVDLLKSINIQSIIEQVKNIVAKIQEGVSVCVSNQVEIFKEEAIQIQENVKICM